MKSFYSLVKIAPNSLSDDNLTIGIILSDNNGYRYKFSKEKKLISKSLVSVDNSIIDFLELEISKKIEGYYENLMENDKPNFQNLILRSV